MFFLSRFINNFSIWFIYSGTGLFAAITYLINVFVIRLGRTAIILATCYIRLSMF